MNNKIIIYEQVNFQGLSREFSSDVANLINYNFNDCVSSLKVIGNPWVAYRDVNFTVPLAAYEEGEYAKVEQKDTFSSLQLVTEDLSNPQITLYEHANYQGKSTVINSETDLGSGSGSLNDIISSHKVQRGAWVLYEHGNQTGTMMVARAGQEMWFYELFNDCLSYLRPLKSGKTTLKAVLLWDKKEEKINRVITNSSYTLNSSYETKPFCSNPSQMYDAFISESFNFSSAAGIGIGTKFDLDLSELKKDFAVKETLTVEKGINNTRVEKKSLQVLFSAVVPPRSKLTVDLVTKEVNIKVPVKLIYGSNEILCGEYVCYSELSLTTEDKQEPI